MGMSKDIVFDKEYCRMMHLCMSQGEYGAVTFFVDMHMSNFTMNSCKNSEAVNTKIVSDDYFEQFDTPDLMDVESVLDDGDDGDE